MPNDMTANSDLSDRGDQLDAVSTNNGAGVNLASCSSKREVHNIIEKKRKDRLKEDIEKLRKLIPDSNFVVKKQTHHEVMQTACDYISSLQQQNNDLLLGKKDEVSASVIEQLRIENDVLKAENKRFRDVVEHAGFPPLSDLSKLVLSWKPRSVAANTNITASPGTGVNLAPVIAKAAEPKRKKQGMTVSECLKRVSELDKNDVYTRDSCFESDHKAKQVFDETCTSDSSKSSTEVTALVFTSTDETTTQSSTQSTATSATSFAESCDTLDIRDRITTCEEGADSVLRLCNGSREESVLLSELIAGSRHVESEEDKFRSVVTDQNVERDTIPVPCQTMHDSSLPLLSHTADGAEHSTESETVVMVELADVSSVFSNIPVNTRAAPGEVEYISNGILSSNNDAVNNVCIELKAFSSECNVSTTSQDMCSNDSASSTMSNVVLGVVAPTNSLNSILPKSTNAVFSPSPVNKLVVRNSAEQMFVNLDIGNSVMGSGLVYGKFIYHNGQLVLSRNNMHGSQPDLQYILPNMPQSVFCSPLHNTTILIPSPQVLPVYSVLHQPAILTFGQGEISNATDATPTVGCQNHNTSLDTLLLSNNESCSSLPRAYEPAEVTPMSPVISCVSEKSITSLNNNSIESGMKSMVESHDKECNVSVELVESYENIYSTANKNAPGVETQLTNGEYVNAISDLAAVINSGSEIYSADASETVSTVNDTMVIDTTMTHQTTSCIDTVHSENTETLSNGECEAEVLIKAPETHLSDVSCSADATSIVHAISSEDLSAAVKGKTSGLLHAGDTYDKTAPDPEISAACNACNSSCASSSAGKDHVFNSVNKCLPSQSNAGPTFSTVCTQDSVSVCQDAISKSKTAVEPICVVCSTISSSATILSNTVVSKCLDLTTWSLPWSSSMSTYSSASYTAPSSLKTTLHDSHTSYQTSSMVISSDLNDFHRGFKRKSTMSCSEKAVKSQKMNSVSKYICPPPDSALEKDRCLEIYVLDQLNSNGRIAGIGCAENGFDEYMPVESLTKHYRNGSTCTMETSNPLPSALPVGDEFWRPDTDSAPIMQPSTLKNKSELLNFQLGTPYIDDASYMANVVGMMKPASGAASKCLAAFVPHEPLTSVITDKSSRTISSTAKSKSFTLANFLPASNSSEIGCSGSLTLHSLGVPKSPKIAEPPQLYLTDCGLSNQNVYSHVPKSSVVFGDSFCNSLQDDLSLTDNDLSVFLNDADVFPMLPVKNVDASAPFWNAGIGISNSKTKERGKEMSSQCYKTDSSVPVMPSFGDSYRMEWNTNDRTEVSNSRHFFDVTSLTGKSSSTTQPVLSGPTNADQQHVSHFPIHQMQNHLYAPFDSFNVPASLPYQVIDQSVAHTTANICAVRTIAERTVSSSREIFSLARQVVSSTGNHSSTLTSSTSNSLCATPVNSFWSPCASSSYSGATNRISTLHSPPLYYKKDNALSGVWSSRRTSSNTAVSKPSFWGLQLPLNGRDFDTGDTAGSGLYNDSHQESMHIDTPQSVSDNVIQSTTVSLSFRPQIELGISKPHCKWPEEELYPFPAARKKATSSASGGRQCIPIVSTVRPFDHLVNSTERNNAHISSSNTNQAIVGSGCEQTVPVSNFPRRTCESQTSSSSFSFPFALPQPVTAPVSSHKLPSFSFAAVPPIPDFLTFNFTPSVPIPSIPSNQCNRQSSISASQWNFSTTAQCQNIGKQPLAFAISSQLNGFAEPNSTAPSSVSKRLSPTYEHIQPGQKPSTKTERVLHKSKEYGLVSSSQPLISSAPYMSPPQHPEQHYFVNPSTILPPCSTVVKGRTCSDRGSTFTDYCLTSPPLHHPPILTSGSSDNCSAKQLKASSSFAITNLAPILTFSASPSIQPSCPPTSLITVSAADSYCGMHLDAGNNSFGQTRLDQEFLFPSYGMMESQQNLKCNSKRSSKCAKRSPKYASDTSKVSLPVYTSQSNGLRQSLTSEMPTYLTNAPLTRTGFTESSVFHNPEVNECQRPASLNPVFGPIIPNSLSLNTLAFPQTSAGSALHMPTSHGHMHNFGIGAMFSDLTNPTSVIAPHGIRGLRLPAPATPTFLTTPDAVSYQHHYGSVNQQSFTSRAMQSSSMHNMSINSLLGHEQRDLPPTQFNSAITDVVNSSGMSQLTAPSFDFIAYGHHR